MREAAEDDRRARARGADALGGEIGPARVLVRAADEPEAVRLVAELPAADVVRAAGDARHHPAPPPFVARGGRAALGVLVLASRASTDVPRRGGDHAEHLDAELGGESVHPVDGREVPAAAREHQADGEVHADGAHTGVGSRAEDRPLLSGRRVEVDHRVGAQVRAVGSRRRRGGRRSGRGGQRDDDEGDVAEHAAGCPAGGPRAPDPRGRGAGAPGGESVHPPEGLRTTKGPPGGAGPSHEGVADSRWVRPRPPAEDRCWDDPAEGGCVRCPYRCDDYVRGRLANP